MYGGNWRTLSTLGEGAQGHVFTVRDTREPDGPLYALKRLKKESRSERFLQEIQALRSISHQNIIRIVDHSNGETTDDEGYPYYFVMPIAENGNLRKRVTLYKDSIDSVISVFSGLLGGVEAAHSAGYVHRDIKPENILFSSLDHHPWLSDFGICHNINHERLTKFGDVMGPRGFTAPELKDRSSISVDPSCDLYSLGKVVYYMISGGTVIGREHFDAEFRKLSERGERYRLLQILLSRMIAPIENRVKSVQDVALDLTRIRDWESSAATLGLSADVLAKVNKQQQASVELSRIKADNARIQGDNQLVLDNTSNSICAWLRAELVKLKALMSQSGTYTISVQDAVWNETHYFGTNDYVALSGVELVFKNNVSNFPVNNVIKFFVCRKARMQIVFGNDVRPVKPVDPEMSLIPYFLEYNDQQSQFQSIIQGFIKSKSAFDRSRQEFMQRMQQTGRRHTFSEEPLIAKKFVGAPLNLIVEFKASEWPAVVERVQSVFSETIGVVLDYTSSDTRSIGP